MEENGTYYNTVECFYHQYAERCNWKNYQEGKKSTISETKIPMLQNYTGLMKNYFENIYS